MASSSSLTEQLATLGIHLPAWPEEPEGDSATDDWIQRGRAYAEGVRLWRAQLRNAPESTKGVVDQLLRHLHDTGQVGVWDQLVYGAIKPEVQGSAHYERWQACTKLIRSSALTPAQLLGMALDQAEKGHFETARQGFNSLTKAGLLDQALAKDLCLNVLCGAADNLPSGDNLSHEEAPQLIDKYISIAKLIRDSVDFRPSPCFGDANAVFKGILHRVANPVILVAGMRHSASTALFNAIKIGMQCSDKEISSNYSEYFEITAMKKIPGLAYLTKIHEYREDHFQRADFVITTRRDLRDSVASANRRGFSLLAKVGGAVQYAAYNRSLHEAWHDKSDYELSYEQLIGNPVQAIKDIFEIIGIDSSLAVSVAEDIKSIPTNNYAETLLSDSHITDPRRELTFRDSLEPGDISSITERNRDWLQRYSYI